MPLSEVDRLKAFFVLGAAILCSCGSGRPADIRVTNVWAQPVNASGTALAVYMTIADACARPEILASVDAGSSYQASLHASSVVDDELRMTPLQSVPVACDKPILLKPMGTHVMVTGISKPPEIGDRFPLKLTFDRSGDVDVVAEVTTLAVLENVDPMNMHMKSGHMGMQGMH